MDNGCIVQFRCRFNGCNTCEGYEQGHSFNDIDDCKYYNSHWETCSNVTLNIDALQEQLKHKLSHNEQLVKNKNAKKIENCDDENILNTSEALKYCGVSLSKLSGDKKSGLLKCERAYYKSRYCNVYSKSDLDVYNTER